MPVHAIGSGSIHAKLGISQPGDRYEQEADQVAEQVMRMPDSDMMQNAGTSDHPSPLPIQQLSLQSEEVHRQPDEEEEEETLQAKEVPGHTAIVTPDLETSIHSLRGGGQPLNPATRAFMEPRFGHDFSQVRIHTDGKAAESTRAVNALAYTVGRDVVFGAKQYAPETMNGQRLLAHELTHVLQQSKADKLRVDQGDKKCGQSASFFYAAQAGTPIVVRAMTGIGIQREAATPPGAPLTAEELFQIIVTKRAFTFNRGGRPVEDPAGVGRSVGPAAGGRLAGQSVFAVVQITDKNGNLVDIGYGEHTAYGAEHAEPRAIRALRNSIAGRDVRGGRMLAVLDQVPCPPGRADCMGALRNFAKQLGLVEDIRVPLRPNVRNPAEMARPRTAAMGSQRTDFPPVQLVPLEQALALLGQGQGGPGGTGPGPSGGSARPAPSAAGKTTTQAAGTRKVTEEVGAPVEPVVEATPGYRPERGTGIGGAIQILQAMQVANLQQAEIGKFQKRFAELQPKIDAFLERGYSVELILIVEKPDRLDFFCLAGIFCDQSQLNYFRDLYINYVEPVKPIVSPSPPRSYPTIGPSPRRRAYIHEGGSIIDEKEIRFLHAHHADRHCEYRKQTLNP